MLKLSPTKEVSAYAASYSREVRKIAQRNNAEHALPPINDGVGGTYESAICLLLWRTALGLPLELPLVEHPNEKTQFIPLGGRTLYTQARLMNEANPRDLLVPPWRRGLMEADFYGLAYFDYPLRCIYLVGWRPQPNWALVQRQMIPGFGRQYAMSPDSFNPQLEALLG